MSLVKSLHAMFQRPAKARERCLRRKARLCLEVLEGRTLLSTYTVDRLTDTGSGSGLTGDLRYCITHATSGQDTINFGITGTINLTSALPNLSHGLTIQGPGAERLSVRRDTGGNYRIFTVANGQRIVISGLTIANGIVNDNGGGVLNQGTLTVRNSILSGNSAHNGGGIYSSGSLTIYDSTFSGNSANVDYDYDGGGGGIFYSSSLGGVYIYNSNFSGNSANGHFNGGGGGIFGRGEVDVSNCTFSGNAANDGGGGGIFNAGILRVEDSRLSGNTGRISGGIENVPYTALTVTNSTISGNTGIAGGGIQNSGGGALLMNSTVSGNTGDGIVNTGRLDVRNSTIASNTGWGINNFQQYEGTVTVTNSTISGNTDSGGVSNSGRGTFTAGNTIIAGNARDLDGRMNSQGHNLIGNSTGGTGYAPSDLLNVDARLGPLQNNGGPTQTIGLLYGSPAIDAGDNTDAPSTDQRGLPRIAGSGIIDIGAFEAQDLAVVRTPADSGPGSFRQAIINSNGVAGSPVNSITFVIGTGVQTINPTSPLPAITHPVTIDGTTQPGYNGSPLIELDGSLAGSSDGFRVQTGPTGNTVIRGLAINSFSGAGISIRQTSYPLVIQGDFIGTDVTGTRALGNGYGVLVYTASVTIGGTAAASRNVISGNTEYGVWIGAANVLIQGNLIGTDIAGTHALGNGHGVYVSPDAGATIGGIQAGNVISGNTGDGIVIGGPSASVQGNFIGTDFTGTQALGNGGNGISLHGYDYYTQANIGGTAPGAGNVISANGGDGIFIYGRSRTTNARVEGNLIGTDVTGTQDLGNHRNGITVTGPAAHYSTIGGTASGAGNTIAYNRNDGVLVDTGALNSIRQNSILSSGNLGIELVNSGNDNQVAPELTSATSDGSTITIEGTITDVPNTTFALDFFANTDPNPTGFGEGETVLGSASVTTNADGTASFTVSFAVAVDPGQSVSATATAPNGNTSAFAADVMVTPAGDAPSSRQDVPAVVALANQKADQNQLSSWTTPRTAIEGSSQALLPILGWSGTFRQEMKLGPWMSPTALRVSKGLAFLERTWTCSRIFMVSLTTQFLTYSP